MKKILSGTTSAIQTGLKLKGFIDSALHPIKTVRDIAKKIIIKSIVFVVKQAISITTQNKTEENSNIIIRQLNALTNPEANMNGLNKTIQFKMTLDSILEESNPVEEYKILKFIDLTKIKQTITNYKNEMRLDIYNYITENNFENLNTIVNGVNEVLGTPTEIIGCEFAKCNITIENHDSEAKNFLLSFDVSFALKAQNSQKNSLQFKK